jgi:hypothetical protein
MEDSGAEEGPAGYQAICGGDGIGAWESETLLAFRFHPTCRFQVSKGVPKDDPVFYMNANFFSPGGQPLGLVVVEGRRHAPRRPGGGYFYVDGGKPQVSRSCPRSTEFAAQTHLTWGIHNGRATYGGSQGREATWRNLVGQDAQGNIYILVSKAGGQIPVRNLVDEGKRWGMVQAILFDAGSSVDYRFAYGDCREQLKVLPHLLAELAGYGAPPVYLAVYR